MADALRELTERVRALEVRDEGKDRMIKDLEKENDQLKKKVKSVQELHDLKQDCVFSARMKFVGNLSSPDPSWKTINQIEKMYKTSRHFDAVRGEFTAPVKGDYHMDMGVRQKQQGGLEVMLHIKPVRSDVIHAYIGRTSGSGDVCHKTMVLSLNPGDKVFGVVRRTSGSSANIEWCAFHGFLITASLSHICSNGSLQQ